MLTLWEIVVDVFGRNAAERPAGRWPRAAPRMRTIESGHDIAAERLASKAKLVIAEDNDAVIKIIQKGRAATMRHVHRTRRVAIDWFVEVIQPENIQLRFVSTEKQCADICTKAFTNRENGTCYCGSYVSLTHRFATFLSARQRVLSDILLLR